jgi:hypothetical protein
MDYAQYFEIAERLLHDHGQEVLTFDNTDELAKVLFYAVAGFIGAKRVQVQRG